MVCWIRSVDADDRRVCRLQLTEPAQRIADESRAASGNAWSAVLDELDAGQLDSLERGLEVLAEMTRMLHEETTMTAPLAIDCQHLTHRYGQFTAVDDLSLQVRLRRDGRPARTQRCRQDHGGACADHPDAGSERRR